MGAIAEGVRRLGVDHGHRRCGGRSREALKGRVSLMRRRLAKLKFLRSRRLRKGHLFFTGVLPAVQFGAEMALPAPRERRAIRTAAARERGAFVAGGAPVLYWLCMPAGDDPQMKQVEAAILRYALEWWLLRAGSLRPRDACTARELRPACAAGQKAAYAKRPGQYRHDWNPAYHAIMAAEELGWCFLDPVRIRTERWGELDVTQGALAMLRKFVR